MLMLLPLALTPIPPWTPDGPRPLQQMNSAFRLIDYLRALQLGQMALSLHGARPMLFAAGWAVAHAG